MFQASRTAATNSLVRTKVQQRCAIVYRNQINGATPTGQRPFASYTIASSSCSRTIKPTLTLQPTQNVQKFVRTGGLPQQKRMMGGGDAPMPRPQSADAVLFGGHSTQPEGWETTMHVGYSLSLVLCAMVLFFEPGTGIDNWANQEARARLKLKEEHGWTNEMFQFGVHYQNLNEDEVKEHWDNFTSKASTMNEDDDDEEE
jgi:ESSS subunit of NADH:ubiquinone oxidoreductase (complex I)